MGLALPAELNGYPGPKHVLDLAEALALDPEQIAAVTAVFEKMSDRAQDLGRRYVEREGVLDAAFASGHATAEQLQAELDELGRLTAQLRFAHASVDAFLAYVYELRAVAGVPVCAGVHSVRAVPRSWIEAVAAWSERTGQVLHVHASEQRRELAECIAEHGMTPIRLLDACGRWLFTDEATAERTRPA